MRSNPETQVTVQARQHHRLGGHVVREADRRALRPGRTDETNRLLIDQVTEQVGVASRRTAVLASTMSIAWASNAASSSRSDPERTTSSVSARPISGRRNSSWKFRDRVGSAPTRRTRRLADGRLASVETSSAPASKTVSA